jgi:cell division septation protein DedD
MTVYNLGPLNEEQDYLDPRGRGGRAAVGRGGFRRVLLTALTVAVMALFGGGLWYTYKETAHRGPAGETPLLRADDRAMKIRPELPGGMAIPNQDSFIYNPAKAPQGQVERLLPPPETPMARPVAPPPPAPEPTQAAAEPPAAATTAGELPTGAAAAPPAAVPVTAPTPAALPSQVAAAMPSNPPAPAAAVPAKPAGAAAAPLPPPSAGAASAKSYRIQLGALRTDEAARQEWERLKRIHADLLGRLGAANARIDLADRGTYYRIQAGPIAEAGAAERICTELKRRNVGCILVRP